MKNINLKDRDIDNRRNRKGGSTVTLSTVLLIIVFLIYGAVYSLSMINKNSVVKIEKEIKNIKNSLASDDYKRVYKFGIKLIDLKEQINDKGFLPLTEEIVKISDKTLSETKYSSLNAKIEGSVSNYKAELIIPDKEFLAKQIRVYKEDDNFSNVFLAGIKNEGETLKADLDFNIGENKIQLVNDNVIEENF